MQVESNMLSSGMEQSSEVHKQLLRLNPSVQIANGSTITYPASDSYMVTLFGEQDSLSFHLLHKGLDTTGMVYVGEVDEYWSVAAWRVYRKPQGVCMQLQTTFTFPEELQNMRCAGAVRALRVLRDAIIEQRTYTVSESRTALDSSGNTVQLEPGTSVRFATDYSNTACAGCHVPFPAGMMPKRCTACVLNALYCSKACQRLHWKEHKESCKPEAMLFMRIYVGNCLTQRSCAGCCVSCTVLWGGILQNSVVSCTLQEMRMIGNGGGLRIYL